MIFNTIQSALSNCFKNEYNDRIALEHLNQKFTYKQLANASNILMNKLLEIGTRKGMHIAVLANDRSIVIVAAIAIYRLGGVFVPLDPLYPINRLEEMGRTSDLSCIIIEDTLPSELQELWRSEIVEELQINRNIFFELDTCIGSDFDLELYKENDPIYLYFTSGTTGQPNPVIGRNISLMHFIDWEINAFGFDKDIRISQLTSPCHDPYLRDVFTTLTIGGTICIPDNRYTILSPFEFKNWVNKEKVNVIHCTPTMFRNLCNSGLDKTDFKELKWVLIAGEQLLAKDIRGWYNTFGERIQLINLYGPTETTLAKLYYHMSSADTEKVYIPIGKPINDTTTHIFNQCMKECKEGEIGELYINTPYRTLGYYKNDEMNEKAFIKDPYSQDGEVVLYKTGDFVKLLPDKNIEFVERRDKQIKIRGIRIELGEIENELSNYSGVKACTIQMIKRDALNDEEYLVAYYVSDVNITKDELASFLRERLPDFMVPQQYIKVDSFPTNVNGKIDYDSLQNLSEAQKNESNSGVNDAVSSSNELEDRLILIWKEILGKDEIGVNDVFMEIGGDSLSIMLLIPRIQTEFDLELSLWQVFDNLTIEKLATQIKENNI